MVSRCVVGAVALLSAVPLVAQQEKPLPGFANEVKVNNITVDVQVRDAQGAPVSGLRKEDFQVLEDGAAQQLTNFLAVGGGSVAAARDASMVGQPAPRFVLVFFDLYLMTEPDKRVLVRGLEDQLGAGLPPAMQVAVVSFDGSLHVHTPPTESREKVIEALKQVERTAATGLERQISLSSYNVADGPGQETYTQYELRRNQNLEYWHEMRTMVSRVESAFTAAVQRFSATDARKIVILVSPGFPRASNLPMYRDYDFYLDTPPDFRNAGLLARAAFLASDLEYTLYTLDASGNQTLNADASIGPNPQFNDVANVSFWRESDRKDTLIRAARMTGGEAIFSTDASAAMADVERLTSSFYSLGYQPEHWGDGKKHDVKVEVVGHSDYTLTYRTSYIDRPFDERQAERSRAALLTGDTANPLGLILALDKPAGRFRLGAQRMRVYTIMAELRIPYARLVMIPRGPVAWGQVQVVVLAVDTAGNQSELTHQKVPIELPASKLEEARQRGYFAYTFKVEIEGGSHSLRIAVDDLLANSTSTISADLKL